MKEREKIIMDYINAYNRFDINEMLMQFDQNVRFENISNGKSNMLITGLIAFKDQAEKAAQLFSERKQQVISFQHGENETEVQLAYEAVLAADLPNGFKKGEVLKLEGKSIFQFSGNKITALTDIS